MAKNNPFALKFNKSKNTKVVIPKKPQITPATNLTVMLWAFFPKTPSELQYIIANVQTGGYSIWVDSSTISFMVYIGGGYREAIYNHSVIPETWYMLAGTYNGSQLVFYVDGEEVANVSYSGSITYHSSTPLVLSGNPDGSGNITSGPFEGIIDNVSVWNKTLTPEEIKYYMRRKLKGDEEGLAGYWPLDEGQGNIAHDLSPYQNHGTIYNAEWVEGEVDLAKYSTLENINISKTNIWYTDIGNINLSCSVSHLDGKSIQYKLLVNGEEVIPLSQSYPTPAELDINVPINAFTDHENLLQLIIVDEGEEDARFSYIIKKENRDTFTFKRVFDFKEDYITDENIEVIYGRGLTLKEIGRGEVNIEIPTEGKSKISNIVIEGGEDKEEELTIEREMTYLNDLGEGKVYESRLLTEYSDIMDIRTSVVDGKVYDCGENSTTNPIEVNKFSTGTVTFRDEYIYLTASSGQTAVIATRNAIDLSKVSKVVIDNDYNPSDYVQYKVCTMSINKTIESAGDEGVRFIKTNRVERKEHVLDVADLEGEFYIKISVNRGTRNGSNPIAKIHGIYLLDADDKIISRPKHLCISNNKYLTYRDNEFIEVEPTVENFKGKSIYLPDLTTPTDKVVLTMEGGEELEDGRLYRKTIDMSKYKSIERIEVK